MHTKKSPCGEKQAEDFFHFITVELFDKVRVIRVTLLELNRIASHLLWIGAFLMDLGATSPFFYAFREREMILNYFEKLTGQRMMYNYFVFGGLRKDIEFLEDIHNIISILPQKLNDYEKIITENPIFKRRCVNKGVLEKNVALDYSITGVNLRASGVNYDLRKPGRNYDDLYKALNSYSNIHPMESCWIIKSTNSTSYIRDYLKTKLDSNDKLFVSKLDDWASFNFTQTEVNWLKQS